MTTFNIKAERTFTVIRKYGFLFTLFVAIGGLWEPKLGLLVIPVMLGLILFSFYKGRFWCGNVCAHGSLFDSLLFRFSRNKKIPAVFKSKWLSIGFLGIFSYKLISKFITVAGLYGSASFFDKMGLVFVSSYIMVTIVGGFLALVVAPRTWCNFCPMGVMQKMSYKLGKKVKVTTSTDEKVTAAQSEMCHKCGKCSRVCPMQLAPYTQFNGQNQFDDSNCLKCSTCVANCPAGILSINNEKVADILKEKISIAGYEDRQKIASQLIKIRELKDDIIEYTFEFMDDKEVHYKAGQFILVKIQESPEMFRAYSISSYNEDNKRLSVTIKKMADGFGTEHIYSHFRVGDTIELEGPLGHELVIDKNQKKVLLVAGGIGITPFIPIVTDILKTDNQIKKVTLVYGANTESEMIYTDEFEALKALDDRFELVPVIAFDDNWQGEKGFVTDYFKKMNDIDEHKIYMCGPPPMVNAAMGLFEKMDLKRNKIFYESA